MLRYEVLESFPRSFFYSRCFLQFYYLFWKFCFPLNLPLYDCQGNWSLSWENIPVINIEKAIQHHTYLKKHNNLHFLTKKKKNSRKVIRACKVLVIIIIIYQASTSPGRDLNIWHPLYYTTLKPWKVDIVLNL